MQGHCTSWTVLFVMGTLTTLMIPDKEPSGALGVSDGQFIEIQSLSSGAGITTFVYLEQGIFGGTNTRTGPPSSSRHPIVLTTLKDFVTIDENQSMFMDSSSPHYESLEGPNGTFSMFCNFLNAASPQASCMVATDFPFPLEIHATYTATLTFATLFVDSDGHTTDPTYVRFRLRLDRPTQGLPNLQDRQFAAYEPTGAVWG
jgi:hypothetical protein